MTSKRYCFKAVALQVLLATAFQTAPVHRTKPRMRTLVSKTTNLLSTEFILSTASDFFARVPPREEEVVLPEVDDIPDFITAAESNHAVASRRAVLASALTTAGAALAAAADPALALPAPPGKLQYEKSPVNKRSGVTVFDAEQAGYNVRFVTYLSRFLLCFDADCQKWWYARAADIPRTATSEQVDAQRMRQFGGFAASVEVGLQEYRGPEGPKRLMNALLKRYCPDPDTQLKMSEGLSESDAAKFQREVKEARRQIALLFGLMETNQPVEDITKLLAAIDNGSIDRVEVVEPGSGYAPGYGAPLVTFPPPEAGEEFTTAKGRATLRPNGKILRCDLVNRGFGYTKPPTVTISPPAAAAKGDDTATAATAKALLFRNGPNKGRLERIQLVDGGSGYKEGEPIKIQITPPEMSPQDGGVTATATAILELEVASIEITDPGSGYAVEKPITVTVEPPPITARVNMNDPMTARIISADQLLPATTIPSKELRKKMDQSDPASLTAILTNIAANDGKGGGGGCIGRACYDQPVVVMAYPRAEIDSYKSYRKPEDASRVQNVEDAIKRGKDPTSVKVVSGTSSGAETRLPFWGVQQSSAQLLSLLPAGIGLEYNPKLKRYSLAVDQSVRDNNPNLFTSNKPLDPEFGPRGRSPIERDMKLGIGAYLRFAASGAVCCSAAHLLLTPIDVVKTKVQTNPVKYTGVISSFKTILEEDGAEAFLNGWAPTFLGYFVWGGVAYTLTELARRTLQELAGSSAPNLEVPIILTASALAAVIGSVAIAPFEAVRIRSVAQSGTAPNILEVYNRMAKVSEVDGNEDTVSRHTKRVTLIRMSFSLHPNRKKVSSHFSAPFLSFF